MITSEKHLLYILGVNKEQLDYLLAHSISLQVNQRRIVMEKLQLDKLIHLKEN